MMLIFFASLAVLVLFSLVSEGWEWGLRPRFGVPSKGMLKADGDRVYRWVADRTGVFRGSESESRSDREEMQS